MEVIDIVPCRYSMDEIAVSVRRGICISTDERDVFMILGGSWESQRTLYFTWSAKERLRNDDDYGPVLDMRTLTRE